ncbi:MAG: hypothetical protein K0B02_00220 [DPANN group archaeon]|nr:hypothetical protein [DPANN group archaeon]
MGILGITYDKIMAERTGVKNQKISVNTTSLIKDITKVTLNAFEKTVESLNVKFELKSEFKPKIGFVEITGTIIYTVKNTDDLIKQWKKNKTMSEENRVELTNYIFRNALPKALMLTDLMQLPPVVDIPQAVAKQNK